MRIAFRMAAATSIVAVTLTGGIADAQSIQASGIIQDKQLAVDAGETLLVPSGRVSLFVENFTMGNESRIVLPGDTRLFVLNANRATVGNRAVIFGKGHDGFAVTDRNRHGPMIVLIIKELTDVRGLHIVSLGGDGLDGPAGRDGKRGPAGSCSGGLAPGEDGESGRNGEDGGDAGDGGRIFLVIPGNATDYGVSMNTAPGEPGKGGPGGAGGLGGRGKTCWKWPRLVTGAGSSGSPGQDGSLGREGNLGEFRTFTFDDSDPDAAIADRLTDIITILREGGFGGDADALGAVLNAYEKLQQ